jgi:hypothetical protein
MYEHFKQPVIPFRAFLKRLARHLGAAIIILAASLAIGIFGYHIFAKLPWIDALLNASMILGGMGPVNTLSSTSAKLFASFYALFSGLIFLVASGVILAPVAHRLLHRFRVEEPGK